MAAVDNLKVFAIAGHTDAAGAAVADVDQEELRLAVGAVLGPGILPNLLDQTANANAFRVRQDTGANMQVRVGNASTAKIDGLVLRGTVAGQGSYIMRIETTTVTITVPAADGTNPSRYGVYAWINDTAYSGTASRAYQGISCIRGTPAGSPVTPTALAVWSAWVLLWEFQLPALATAVTNTILDSGTAFDRRAASSLPVSSRSAPRAFASAALRDADITVPTEGMLAGITGEDRMTVYSGSAWQRMGHYSSAGRTGCSLQRLGFQVVNNNTDTLINWDTEDQDTDGFITVPSTSITIPASLGGLYAVAVDATVVGQPAWRTSAAARFNLVFGAQSYNMLNGSFGSTTDTDACGMMVLPLAGSTVITVNIRHNVGSAQNVTAFIWVYRLSL